jgi:hypothetical protein
MEIEFKPEEKELIRLVQYFRKRGEIFIIENRLGEEHKQLLETCDKLLQQLEAHAKLRQTVLNEREQLKNLVKDNAKCPQCESATQLKLIGTDKNELGWNSNKYKCRKCNISFVWNTPNNPWDMIPYVEHFISDMEKKVDAASADDPSKAATAAVLEQMRANLSKLRPVVEASDLDFKELEERELQMSDLVHKFKKHLMIEKIRMEQ